MSSDLIGNIANISLALSLLVGLVFGVSQVRALPADEQAMFIQFSMLMENLGILVAEKMINVNLVDVTLGSFVSTTWAKFKPMAVNTRQQDNEPFMSEYYQWLAETIAARTQASPRRPAYEAIPPRH